MTHPSPSRRALVAGTAALLAAPALQAQEIRERNDAQHSLEESELKFRSVVESAQDGIVTIDERGRLVALNRSAETMFGWQREEVIGKSFARLVPRPLRAAAVFMLKCVAGGAEHPLDGAAERESAGPAALVAQAQATDLHRIGPVDEHGELVIEAAARVREHGVSLTVAHCVRRVGPGGSGGRGPDRPVLFVAQITHLAGRVGHRVVAPRGEAVTLAVA